jgi:hypothetical protein
MTETIGQRVLERVRRRKLALEAEKPQLHLEQSAVEVQPDPVPSSPATLADIPRVDYRPNPESHRARNYEATQAAFADERVREVRRRWKAGHFDGVPAKLHLGQTDDLAFTLKGGYFSKKKLLAAEPDDLVEIAKTVLELIPEAKL